ncbi:cobalt transporter [Methylovirgula ligni]|uniref:Cation efflux family protein n=1 Tax=Methylovirgula ligni TaxID=569860 RepID=A0A3D9Z2D0_9HYPH|nr:cation transporter [Methylovirgula ligni]QAY94650.1 cobalt transporter [Methylovirgula ligni]REF87469.1 cation efflux family protein [Methylovirgula ligni]
MPGAGPSEADKRLRQTLWLVIGLNLTFFVVEFIVALSIGSVSLFADSVDFVEDTAMSLLVLAAVRLSPLTRARLGFAFAGVLLLPAIAFLVTLAHKLISATPLVPEPALFALTGLAAFTVNTTCALLLARVRNAAGSLTRAAFLSARNDMIANIAIMAAAGVTALWPSIWPDIVVGLGIAALNADAAREIWEAARSEHGAALGGPDAPG